MSRFIKAIPRQFIIVAITISALIIGLLFQNSTVIATNCPPNTISGSWCDGFDSSNLDVSRWTVTNNTTAFWGNGPVVTGGFNSNNVTISNGFLVLKATASRPNKNSYTGTGAELKTTSNYSYGFYEARVRTASLSSNPASTGVSKKGFLSTMFNYTNNSQTEIDHEIQSGPSNSAYVGAYKNFDGTFPPISCSPSAQTIVGPTQYSHTACKAPTPGNIDLSQAFHTLSWNWTPTLLSFAIDGQTVFAITEPSRIPTAPAPLFLNFWLSNGNNFSDVPEVAFKQSISQYYLIDYIRFSPSV
jgi:endo-1,3-1,4-beta-glycanase ExoK